MAGVALFLVLDLPGLLDLASFRARQADLLAWRDARPVAAALVFFSAYVAVTGLSMPGAAALTLIGGALFGLPWGTAIVSFASTLGATLAFLAARFVLRDGVRRRFGDRLRAFDQGVERDGAWYLFTLRLVPAVPFFVLNLVAGLTPLRTRTFAWVSQLGMLPGTLVYVNAGTQLGRIDSPSDVASPGLLGAFVLLGTFPLLARGLSRGLARRRATAAWTRPRRFDRNLVVVGAGSAGLVAAYIAAAVKARVTLVEKHRMGGDCLNTGCVPSKALIRSARLAAQIARAPEFGLEAAPARVDFAAVMARVQDTIRRIEPHDSVERYERLGVEVLHGEAMLRSPWEVEVIGPDGRSRRLTSRAIVIATGAEPTVPPIPGIEEAGYLTSDTVWSLRERPRRLLVLGGGPVGCELAQAFARLGCRVTQVQKGPRLMPREDAEVSAFVAQRLRDDGVAVLLDHEAVRFETSRDGKRLIARHANGETCIAFDAVLVAVGRSARLRGFGLEALGIECGRTIQVDAFLRTRFANIYVAGDAAGPHQFTHAAAHQAWHAAVNALFDPFKRFRVDDRIMPRTTFVDPEVAHVGLNEQDAQARRIDYEATVYDLADLDRAIVDGAASGFVKVLTARGTDRILGATIVGEHAGELLAEYVLAMKHGIGLNEILATIHAYPTMAEANKHAAGAWKRAHAPRRLLAWLERFHAWRLG